MCVLYLICMMYITPVHYPPAVVIDMNILKADG